MLGLKSTFSGGEHSVHIADVGVLEGAMTFVALDEKLVAFDGIDSFNMRSQVAPLCEAHFAELANARLFSPECF